MMMDVVFRTDASIAMGIGHVRRTRSLADALARLQVTPRFITRAADVNYTAALARYEHHILPRAAPGAGSLPDLDEEEDARATIAALRGTSPDWIVVDHYQLSRRWHDLLRAATGAKIAVIDDLADRPLAVDLIIDHNLAADHTAKYESVAAGTPVLGGPRFALISEAYADAPRYAFDPMVRSIGVSMGGIDAAGATGVVLDALAGLDIPVEVATTSANPHLAALQGRSGVTVTVDQPDLAAFFARHDLQVGAGGGASWERCCIGAPALLLAVADNQLAVVPDLVATGAVVTASYDADAIRAAVRGLLEMPARRAAMATAAQRLVDGRGSTRAALRLVRDALTVRPATPADARLMFDWRNDPATRGVSRDGAKIDWNGHNAWLTNVLADSARTLLVAVVGCRPIGVLRFDPAGPNAVEVSLYIDPTLHGLGLGQRMLLAGETAVAGLDIHAEVLDGNAASARMFASAGYAPNGANHWLKPGCGGR